MQLSSDNIMKIQLKWRLGRAVYLPPLFTNYTKSKSKDKGGRIYSMLSLLFIFSFILTMLSRYEEQVPQGFTYGSFTDSTVQGDATLLSDFTFWNEGKDHCIPWDFKTFHGTSVQWLVSTEQSKIYLFGRFGIEDSEMCYGRFLQEDSVDLSNLWFHLTLIGVSQGHMYKKWCLFPWLWFYEKLLV